MKAPVLSRKYLTPAIAGVGILSAAGIIVNAFYLPGWLYSGLIEIVLIALMLILFAENWSPGAVRFGILVYAVTTGIQVIGQRYPALMGEFHYGPALGPFANNVGLLTGLPWFLSMVLSVQMANRLTKNLYLSALTGTILSMVPVIFMIYNGEALSFFYWIDVFPPIRMYVIWFIVMFVLHFSAGQMKVEFTNPASKALYITWFGFQFILFCLRYAVA